MTRPFEARTRGGFLGHSKGHRNRYPEFPRTDIDVSTANNFTPNIPAELSTSQKITNLLVLLPFLAGGLSAIPGTTITSVNHQTSGLSLYPNIPHSFFSPSHGLASIRVNKSGKEGKSNHQQVSLKVNHSGQKESLSAKHKSPHDSRRHLSAANKITVETTTKSNRFELASFSLQRLAADMCDKNLQIKCELSGDGNQLLLTAPETPGVEVTIDGLNIVKSLNFYDSSGKLIKNAQTNPEYDLIFDIIGSYYGGGMTDSNNFQKTFQIVDINNQKYVMIQGGVFARLDDFKQALEKNVKYNNPNENVIQPTPTEPQQLQATPTSSLTVVKPIAESTSVADQTEKDICLTKVECTIDKNTGDFMIHFPGNIISVDKKAFTEELLVQLGLDQDQAKRLVEENQDSIGYSNSTTAEIRYKNAGVNGRFLVAGSSLSDEEISKAVDILFSKGNINKWSLSFSGFWNWINNGFFRPDESGLLSTIKTLDGISAVLGSVLATILLWKMTGSAKAAAGKTGEERDKVGEVLGWFMTILLAVMTVPGVVFLDYLFPYLGYPTFALTAYLFGKEMNKLH